MLRARDHVNVEEQARLSQAVLEQGYSAVLIISSDSVDSEIIFVNPAFTKLTGCTKDELLGQHLSQLEALTGEWQPLRRALSARESFLGEAQIRRRGGQLCSVDCSITPVFERFAKNTHWAVVLRDITTRKEIERRLKLQHDVALLLAEAATPTVSVRRILEAVSHAFNWQFGELWTVDPAKNVLRNMSIWPSLGTALRGWAQASTGLTFARGEGLPGRAWASRQAAYVADLARDCCCKRCALGEIAGLHSGFAFPIALRHEVLGVMAFFGCESGKPNDDLLSFLTTLGSQIGQFIERKTTERALRQSEANLATAQQIAHVGSYEIDVSDGWSANWSIETFRIFGLDPASKELSLTELLRRIVHPKDRARVREAFDRAARKSVRSDLEYRIIRPGGSIRHVHSIAEPVLGSQKKVIKLVGTLQDVTDRKRLEMQVRETSEREQRRIGRDLHDNLGQQLTGIELMCESLRNDLMIAAPQLEQQAAQLGRLLCAAITQTRCIAHGLAAFKIETGGLQSALSDLARMTSSGRFTCGLHCHKSLALKDNETAIHLFRIAQEAVNNAVKHSRGSEVMIDLSHRNGVLRLAVTDNGKGLSTTKRPHQGMGLELMKHRANLIVAELHVESQIGRGVTVTCTVPMKK
jgi:PAS domain S-box-containing protein